MNALLNSFWTATTTVLIPRQIRIAFWVTERKRSTLLRQMLICEECARHGPMERWVSGELAANVRYKTVKENMKKEALVGKLCVDRIVVM